MTHGMQNNTMWGEGAERGGVLLFRHKARVCDEQTDRRTDRQNYDSQDRVSIAASRGKNDVSLLPLPTTL